MGGRGEDGLKLGERVVWLDERDVAQYGTIRYVGPLSGLEHRGSYAGVEFDEPIGGGTGRFKGREVFRAEENHASFVPLCGLLREADFKSPARVVQRRISSFVSYVGEGDNVLSTGPTHDQLSLDIGSCVEARLTTGGVAYGVVRWLPSASDRQMAGWVGVELEEPPPQSAATAARPTDGRFVVDGARLFSCPLGRGAFVRADRLSADKRFTTPIFDENYFGPADSGVVDDYTPSAESAATVGVRRGIQGHANSCYLDASFFAMFAHSSAFDGLLLRPRAAADVPQYGEFVRLLATEVVYPLRRCGFVRADHVIKVRRLLSELLPRMDGLTTDEKDPEEFLNALLADVLRPQPFVKLKLHLLEDAFICNVITEESEAIANTHLLPTTQQLLENSMFASGKVEFGGVPRLLILQLPRYGAQKLYKQILPNDELDLTHLISGGPRPCSHCGELADFMCEECFLTGAESLAAVTACAACFEREHSRSRTMADHSPSKLSTSAAARQAVQHRRLPIARQTLQLSAVLCIETSHYVAFCRCGETGGGRWVLFDSMARREQDERGAFCVPEVAECPLLGGYLNDDGRDLLRAAIIANQQHSLPKNVLRLLKDCYICFYVSPESRLFQ